MFAARAVWEKFEPTVMEFRKRNSFPQYQEFHEYLAKEVKKRTMKAHPDYVQTHATNR